MNALKLTFCALLLFIRGFSFLLFYIIWNYLKQKELAMQTLKDELIKELKYT